MSANLKTKMTLFGLMSFMAFVIAASPGIENRQIGIVDEKRPNDADIVDNMLQALTEMENPWGGYPPVLYPVNLGCPIVDSAKRK